MSGRDSDGFVAQSGALSVSLCSAGHVHLRMQGDAASFDLPLSSEEAAGLAGALMAAAADAKVVEQGGSAATH